jgi:hypothetical protein
LDQGAHARLEAEVMADYWAIFDVANDVEPSPTP